MNPTDNKPVENNPGVGSPLTTPVAAAVPTAAPVETANVVQAGESNNGGSGAKWMMIIGVVVLVVALGVGALYFRNMQAGNQEAVTQSTTTPAQTQPTTESELSEIESSFSTTSEVDNLNEDFSQVDQDIQTL